MKNLMQQTSIEAYHELQNVGEKQRMVLHAIDTMVKASDYDIANFLNWEINRVTPRRNELAKRGLIHEATRAVHPTTHKRVIYWSVTEESLPVAVKSKTSKLGKCVECGTDMKKKVTFEETQTGSYRSTTVIICPKCHVNN